ncbi:Cell cycle serine/threonine-protein kinase cdc5/MSD2 [Xylographa bjoerkii]|nr:Cell cycle serine/threonine-protein kinase cdc5/MSD2 [Xylographa bjoerkii]
MPRLPRLRMPSRLPVGRSKPPIPRMNRWTLEQRDTINKTWISVTLGFWFGIYSVCMGVRCLEQDANIAALRHDAISSQLDQLIASNKGNAAKEVEMREVGEREAMSLAGTDRKRVKKPVKMQECLSPRSANIQSKAPPITKPKDKNHASPPPKYVIQPQGLLGEPGEKYSMGRELGKGGFAICYEGTLLGQKYGKTSTFALKIVKAKMGLKKMEEKVSGHYTNSRNYKLTQYQFRTELQIHSKMRHPNIVEFHRAFTFEENTYIVLELCPNGSLKDMVQKRRCLSLPEVRRYGIQLCGAIKYLHSRNVIHRDLKMGNIFLDRDMNIKLGDFGLAAILITESDVTAVSRRTTLCGTPNYIAPEILERGRKGHDYKVDIWALGVIFFALLTGYPPFSDKVQEEIYRKVRCLDYTWPANTRNDYPEEAKALVSSLLKTSAEERPEPDQIVGHPFFSLQGGNAIPSLIEIGHFSKKPEWLEDVHPRGDSMSKTTPRVSVEALSEQCGVGCFSEIPYAVVGEHVGRSIYQELLWEDSVGKAPTVPLPEDFVYASDNSSAFEKEVKPKRPVTRRPESMRVPSTRLKSSIATAPSDSEDPRKTLPLRSTSSRSVASSVASMRIPRSRMKPSIKTVSAEDEEPKRIPSRSASGQSDFSTRIPSHASKSSITVVEAIPEVSRPTKPYRTVSSGNDPSASVDMRTDLKPPGPPSALIGPHDVSDYVVGSKPSEVITMLERFSATLAKCLRDITRANSSSIHSKSKSPSTESRPHVVKWVDYTNKFGIGYILANGNIGCVFNGTEQRASTCIMVPNAEDHLRRRDYPTYTERHQIVPRNGAAVAFLENRSEQGLSRTLIPPQHFQINIGKTGLPDKLSPVPNPYDNEKRRMLNLWDKFAKYMTQTLGEKTDSTSDQPTPSNLPPSDSGTFVKFYQRLGNVGIWAFANQTFQFNFPDHTKLVLSAADGGADFYHLSVSAAQLLKKGRLLPKAALEERDVLSYPLGLLLSGRCGDKDFRAVVAANELVAKVRFVREVVGVWARNGGLGCMGKREMRWEGLAEIGGRERAVWVTVGKGGGDARVEGAGRKVS